MTVTLFRQASTNKVCFNNIELGDQHTKKTLDFLPHGLVTFQISALLICRWLYNRLRKYQYWRVYTIHKELNPVSPRPIDNVRFNTSVKHLVENTTNNTPPLQYV